MTKKIKMQYTLPTADGRMLILRKAIKTNFIYVRDFEPGEDLSHISVAPEYSPKIGDVIGINPQDTNDQWLISKEFYEENYTEEIF